MSDHDPIDDRNDGPKEGPTEGPKDSDAVGPAPPRLFDYVPEGTLVDGSAILDRFMRWAADAGFQLYPAQEEALLEVMSGQHVILSTPTGSGKSLVALGMHTLALCRGKRSFYTAPIKALVSEKFFALCDAFGPEQVGMLTGDASINWSAPIICCTAEVLANMAVANGERTDAPYVVMDEFHYYGDRDRGVAWQIPLLELPRTQFLLMSATLGDTSDIERRIEAVTGRGASRVHADERPVPLDFRYAETAVHETVEGLLRSGRAPIYIVHFTQREAAEQAQALTSAQLTDRDEKRAVLDAIAGFRFDSPYGKDVRRMLGHGIGLHHAGLLPKYRLLVERLAQKGLLKVICGTDTLGVGVNVPIRTVLFSQLCKFDGEKTGILSVRDFKQIAGRAGRKGFDDAGSVVVQAPEHVIENLKLEARAQAQPGRKKKFVKRKPPERGYVAWNEQTMERLIESPPETLVPRFVIGHGLLIGCLKSSGIGAESGYRRVLGLIDRCHEDDARQRALRREAATLFRSLRRAGVVEVVRSRRGGEVRVSEDLDADFSLHHTLSLYLVEAASVLDPMAETTPVDVLAFAEAILENPRAILIAQEKRERGEAIARMKAEGLDYDERMEKLEKITYPKPNEQLVYQTFELFRDAHPWVGREAIRPKGIAREMFDVLASFDDHVKRLGIARLEGVLLRYLGQVHDTLARSLPAPLHTPAMQEMIGYFRALIARVDTSLLQEWEKLVAPAEPAAPVTPGGERAYDLASDPPALRARIRSEVAGLLRALARSDLVDAAERIRARPEGPWTASALEDELAEYHAEFETIRFDPAARQGHSTLIDEAGPRRWRVRQVLLDERDEGVFYLDLEVDLTHDPNPDGPLLALRGVAS